LSVNGKKHAVDVAPDKPLLWVLRENIGLTGTKFGCGAAQCGACTVHLDGVARFSCVTPVKEIGDRKITTIEGLAATAHGALQQAWIELQVPQCGYCQPGFLMAASALLQRIPQPTDADINASVANICRCGTYSRIRAAIHSAAAKLGNAS